MLLRTFLFAMLLALLPGVCQAGESLTVCGKLPIGSATQAICVARHYLEAKSELCVGVVRYDYVTEPNSATWVVRVVPQKPSPQMQKPTPTCTGDVLELDRMTGSLIRWQRVALGKPPTRYAM